MPPAYSSVTHLFDALYSSNSSNIAAAASTSTAKSAVSEAVVVETSRTAFNQLFVINVNGPTTNTYVHSTA